LCFFGLDVHADVVGNAYLVAYTKEELHVLAGPEFGDLQGCLLIIVKALHGLWTSGARWHECFADTAMDMDMDFYPWKANPDVWMKASGTLYDFGCAYVDDLACITAYPFLFFQEVRGYCYTSSRQLRR
jgi:hypothetical protein